MKMDKKKMIWGGVALLIIVALVVIYKKYGKDKIRAKFPNMVGGTADLNRDLLLKEGVQGAEVGELQQRLKRDGAAGFLGTGGPANDGVDEDFGPLTRAALQEVKNVEEITLNQYDANTSNAFAPVTTYSEMPKSTW